MFQLTPCLANFFFSENVWNGDETRDVAGRTIAPSVSPPPVGSFRTGTTTSLPRGALAVPTEDPQLVVFRQGPRCRRHSSGHAVRNSVTIYYIYFINILLYFILFLFIVQ